MPEAIEAASHAADAAHTTGGLDLTNLVVLLAAAVVGGVVHADRIHPLAHRARGFIRRQDALARLHHGVRDFVQCLEIHCSAPSFDWMAGV